MRFFATLFLLFFVACSSPQEKKAKKKEPFELFSPLKQKIIHDSIELYLFDNKVQKGMSISCIFQPNKTFWSFYSEEYTKSATKGLVSWGNYFFEIQRRNLLASFPFEETVSFSDGNILYSVHFLPEDIAKIIPYFQQKILLFQKKGLYTIRFKDFFASQKTGSSISQRYFRANTLSNFYRSLIFHSKMFFVVSGNIEEKMIVEAFSKMVLPKKKFFQDIYNKNTSPKAAKSRKVIRHEKGSKKTAVEIHKKISLKSYYEHQALSLANELLFDEEKGLLTTFLKVNNLSIENVSFDIHYKKGSWYNSFRYTMKNSTFHEVFFFVEKFFNDFQYEGFKNFELMRGKYAEFMKYDSYFETPLKYLHFLSLLVFFEEKPTEASKHILKNVNTMEAETLNGALEKVNFSTYNSLFLVTDTVKNNFYLHSLNLY